MKNLITFLMFASIFSGAIAQNVDGAGKKLPQATQEIQALYAQQKELKATGNIAELAKNREAIIAAWQEINPTVAAEMKPNKSVQSKSSKPEVLLTNPTVTENKNPLWTNDLLINSGKFDGIDIDTAQDGSIYIVGYENKSRYGLGNDVISIYKSTDNGISFAFLTGVSGPKDYTKIKLTLMDKGVNKYLFVTTTSTDEVLTNYRYSIDGGPFNFTFEFISQDVIDFDIAVDYEFETTAQLYAVYTKQNGDLYSARTIADGSGTGWGDEHDFGYVARECAITYGKENTFMSFVGLNSGNLYFVSNNGYNHPAAWNTRIDVTDGAITESTDISLSAERKEFSEYRALLLASQRPAGSTEDYVGVANIVQGEIAFPDQIIGAGDVRTWDSWCRKENGNTTIRTSFAKTDGDFLSVKNYDDAVWEDSVWVSDNPIMVLRGSSAVAEDVNGNAIAVYIGADRTGLYFDTNDPTAGVNESALNSFIFYPNPANNIINLKADSPINNVTTYNLLGQQVKMLNPNALSSVLNVADLSAGTYFMKVTIGAETGTYKILKN